MTSTLHLIFMGVAGLAFLATIIGAALGYWHIAPSASPHSRMFIRFGMAVSGASCAAAVLSSLAAGATWRDRVHWEIAADAGIALLALGLLIGPVERMILGRGRTARHDAQQRHAEGHGD